MRLTIIPHNTSKVKEIRVSNFLILLAVLVVVVSFIERYSRAKTVSDPSKLAKNNRYLESELRKYEYEYTDLVSKCNSLLSLVTDHQSVREMSGTEKIDPTPSPPQTGETIDELLTDLQEMGLILDRVSNKLSQSPELAKFTPSIAPVEGYIIQSFGKTHYIFTGEERVCQGVDFAAPLGSKVYATAYGVVKYAGVRPHAGLTVEIEHIGGGVKPEHIFVTKYSHLSLLKVSRGQFVNRGEIIGFVGTTGKTIGPMLHYEVLVDGEPRDPVDFILTDNF